MKWGDLCIQNLSQNNLFVDDAHRSRFRELLDCYIDKPFFCRGLCKCMFLAALDQEHFFLILNVLNQTTIEKDRSLELMKEEIRLSGENADSEGEEGDRLIFRMLYFFLKNKRFDQNDLYWLQDLAPESAAIIWRGLQAAKVIDAMSEPGSPGSEEGIL